MSGEIFEELSVDILVFPSLDGYMLASFVFSFI